VSTPYREGTVGASTLSRLGGVAGLPGSRTPDDVMKRCCRAPAPLASSPGLPANMPSPSALEMLWRSLPLRLYSDAPPDARRGDACILLQRNENDDDDEDEDDNATTTTTSPTTSARMQRRAMKCVHTAHCAAAVRRLQSCTRGDGAGPTVAVDIDPSSGAVKRGGAGHSGTARHTHRNSVCTQTRHTPAAVVGRLRQASGRTDFPGQVQRRNASPQPACRCFVARAACACGSAAAAPPPRVCVAGSRAALAAVVVSRGGGHARCSRRVDVTAPRAGVRLRAADAARQRGAAAGVQDRGGDVRRCVLWREERASGAAAAVVWSPAARGAAAPHRDAGVYVCCSGPSLLPRVFSALCVVAQDLRMPGGLLALGVASYLVLRRVLRNIVVRIEREVRDDGDDMIDITYLSLFGRKHLRLPRKGASLAIVSSCRVPCCSSPSLARAARLRRIDD
jgi:hypothetical protein